MHKKLEAELVSLANSILEMKNKDDVNALQKKAQLLYEKLSLLKFVDAYINEMSVDEQIEKETAATLEDVLEHVNKEELNSTIEIEEVVEETVIKEEIVLNIPSNNLANEIDEAIEDEDTVEEKQLLTDDEVEEIFETVDNIVKDDKRDLSLLQFTLEEEFKDAISSDVATTLFERVTKENPVVEAKTESKPKSLNDAVFSKNLQVGLNDRIAFVKHLFDGSQEDFNRVLSQLSSFKTESEAKDFIKEYVKPDYDWTAKLEYEERLMNLIERKFL